MFKSVLNISLGAVFDSAQLDNAKRADLVDEIASQLETIEKEKGGRWADRVANDTVNSPFRRTIPDKAPAIWKKDKLKGDKPPDFIKRHYSNFLKVDGSGLILSDIRKLDFTLYQAISHWTIAGNSLPGDCPLPTRQKACDLELERLENIIGKFTAHEITRAAHNALSREN